MSDIGTHRAPAILPGGASRKRGHVKKPVKAGDVIYDLLPFAPEDQPTQSESTPPRPRRQRRKAEKITTIREKEENAEPLDVAYLAQIFTRCHMPMTDPKKKKVMVFERRDGDKVLRFKADVDSKQGLMYGSDFVTLAAFMTKAREQMRDPNNPNPAEITFPSTAQMLEYLGMEPEGRNYDAMTASIERIQGTTVELVETLHRSGGATQIRRTKGGFITSATLWYNMNRRQLGMKGFENRIVLSAEMMNLLRAARRIEFDKLTVSRKDIGRLQLFALLRDRCSAPDLEELASRASSPEQWPELAYTFIPVHGPNSLETQLGWLKTPKPKEVRRQLREWLQGIRETIWKDCPGELVKGQDGHWRMKIWYYPPLDKDGRMLS